MSVPNKFVPNSSNTFHHDGVTPSAIQGTYSNFTSPMTMRNLNSNHCHFNGGNFFPNSLSYDMTSLPLLPLYHPPPPATPSQRPAVLNSPAAFTHQKPAQMKNFSKPELSQASIADGQANAFNTESVPNSLCWSRQSPLSPFGVLPHEISSDHVEESYDTLTAHFPLMQQPLSNIGCDKKPQLIVPTGTQLKDQSIKQERPSYVAKPVDVKLKNTLTYSPENMNFRNGVISHAVQSTPKVDNIKLINSNYKSNSEQLDSGTATHDYRVFKPPGLYSNSAAIPIVKYTGKPPEQPSLQQHQTMPVKYHEDSQSSMDSLIDDYSSPPQMVPHTPTTKDMERRESFHTVNHMSNVVPSSYREMQQDINSHLVTDKTVTSPALLKLPYSLVANTPHALSESSFHSSRPTYMMYNGANAADHAIPGLHDRGKSEEPQAHPSVKLLVPTTTQNMNGLIGYPSVITRTNRNYEEEKSDKASAASQTWPGDPQIPPAKSDKFQTNLLEPHSLLDRQHSYFDPTCTGPISQPAVKCNPVLSVHNSYEETQQQQSQQHQTKSSHQDPIHYQQQYLPMNKIQMASSNQPSAEVRPAALENNKLSQPKKRKSSSSRSNPHMVQSPALPKYDSQSPNAPSHNLYPLPMQNSNYMDTTCYEATPQQHMPKVYLNDQFYLATTRANHSSSPHNHQTVISSNGSPTANPHHYQMSTSGYFAASQPLLNYASKEFVASPGSASQQTYNFPESSCAPPPLDDDRPKVIVPDVEEEFKFLFDPKLPNYKEIASNEGEEIYKPPTGKASQFYRKNTEFLASYIKFLENNCESVETLADSSSFTSTKNWNRNKVVYQPIAKNKEPTPPAVPTAPATAPVESKSEECDFENDPRYYPLPKSTDKRRLDSSSEDETDNVLQKKSKHASAGKKSNHTSMSNSKERREHKSKARSIKEKELKKDLEAVKMKLEKLKKVKLKSEKIYQKNCISKSDSEEEVEFHNEVKPVKLLSVQKRKLPKNSPENKLVARRKVADRKAKLDAKGKVRGTATNSDSEDQSSSDSDPSWMPNLDDDGDVPVRRSTRIRPVQSGGNSSIGVADTAYELSDKLQSKKDNINNNMEPQKTALTIKVGYFYMEKNHSNGKHIILRKLKGKRLQKFEQIQGNGKFCGTAEFLKLSEIDLSKLQEVEVNIVEKNKARFVVQLCQETDIPAELEIKKNFLKESLCYEDQFTIYIQTLISQSLDSNFLSEVVKENDVYFLKNLKVIDDVTASYLFDLTNVVKWGTNSVNVLVKTWPFLSIKNIRNQSAKNSCKCIGCSESEARQTAIFFGQPYVRETLQGCKSNSNIPNSLDKTVNLCSDCAEKIKLFNKIWHQKYHMFVECAKSVSKKKSEDENKSMTDILNELLADTAWLSKLFYDIRNTWLQIWTIVQKSKKI